MDLIKNLVSIMVYSNYVHEGDYLTQEVNVQAACNHISNTVTQSDKIYIIQSYEGLCKVPKKDIAIYHNESDRYVVITNDDGRYDAVLDLFKLEAIELFFDGRDD